MAAPFHKSEQGFILISAIWLLILCGAIAAVLLLRSMIAASSAAHGATGLKTKLALEGAVEASIADMLFKQRDSHWAYTPAEGSLLIGNHEVSLRISNEMGRLDLNSVDQNVLAAALRDMRIETPVRVDLLTKIAAKRSEKESWRSLDEVAFKTRRYQNSDGIECLQDALTIYSGLRSPQLDHLSPSVAKALSVLPPRRTVMQRGAPVRIKVTSKGVSMIVWLRLIGLPKRPYDVLAVQFRPICGAETLLVK